VARTNDDRRLTNQSHARASDGHVPRHHRLTGELPVSASHAGLSRDASRCVAHPRLIKASASFAGKDERKIRTALATVALHPCFACGGKPAGSAVFIPSDEDERFPRGRLIFYSMCEWCWANVSKDALEELFAQRYGRRAA
jgi:hypothetical protein